MVRMSYFTSIPFIIVYHPSISTQVHIIFVILYLHISLFQVLDKKLEKLHAKSSSLEEKGRLVLNKDFEIRFELLSFHFKLLNKDLVIRLELLS